MATIDDFVAAARQTVNVARAAARQQNVATAQAVAADMRARLNAQTHGSGLTAGGIAIEVSELTKVAIGVRAAPGRDPRVPFWLEYGTVKMSARPFIQPAVAAAEAAHHKNAAAAVEAALQELWK